MSTENLEPEMTPGNPTDEALLKHAEAAFSDAFSRAIADFTVEGKVPDNPIVMRIVSIKPKDHSEHCRCTECLIVKVSVVVNEIARTLESRVERADAFKKHTDERFEKVNTRLGGFAEEQVRNINAIFEFKDRFAGLMKDHDQLKKNCYDNFQTLECSRDETKKNLGTLNVESNWQIRNNHLFGWWLIFLTLVSCVEAVAIACLRK